MRVVLVHNESLDPLVDRIMSSKPYVPPLTRRQKDMLVLYKKANADRETFVHLADRAYRLPRASALRYYNFLASL